ncbi:MAG TPA: NAD(P)/FAD-dependent oxidoreductase [Galbitalea sp.]|jgi:phytoene dehydrogenase-like protein|nr:NAD(P)/FAD-dependent oxidoreductase [Galbitalea sp.]
MPDLDAIVVGAGPNGLAAAVVLARAGLSVRLYEAETTAGGGARTAELTLPGFLHDVCSAVHPMALASPFFRAFGLDQRIDLRVPAISYGHPLDDGRAGLAYRDLAATADALGRDGGAYRRLLGPLAEHAAQVAQLAATSLARFPRHPFVLAALGSRAIEQGTAAWNSRFADAVAPAMLAGVIAHANRRLPDVGAASAGLVLAAHAHAAGWPVPVGGSQAIVDAMVADFIAHGGELVLNTRIRALAELPTSRAVLLDVTPRAFLGMAGNALPSAYARRLSRFRYGNAVAKVDYALDGPVPWLAEELGRTPTVHLGGTRAEVAASERAVSEGRLPESPYVLVTQPSILDPSRAPVGKQVLWAYTHVPPGSAADRSDAVTAQIERFAPGFRDRILASVSSTAVQVESHNANYVGGDIASGDVSLGQLLRRPTLFDPWSTPVRGLYLAGASVAPGPGVHGMGGLNAAGRALAREFGIAKLPSLTPSTD